MRRTREDRVRWRWQRGFVEGASHQPHPALPRGSRESRTACDACGAAGARVPRCTATGRRTGQPGSREAAARRPADPGAGTWGPECHRRNLPVEGADEACETVFADESVDLVIVQAADSTGKPCVLASHLQKDCEGHGKSSKNSREEATRTAGVGGEEADAQGRTGQAQPRPQAANSSSRQAGPDGPRAGPHSSLPSKAQSAATSVTSSWTWDAPVARASSA